MNDRNAFFRQMHLAHVLSTDGIPIFYLSGVRMLQASFPSGLVIDSADYNAICVFLDGEKYPHRAIAQILDFSFGLGYVEVLNAPGFIADGQLRQEERERVERLLAPNGLAAWRIENANGA